MREARWHRRDWFKAVLTLAAAVPAAARAAIAPRLAAAWDDDAGGHHLGLLEVGDAAVRVLASIELPTRAHGLLVEPGGTVLAAARRQGEWLLRWSAHDGRAAWTWSDAERRFNGHLLRHPGGRVLYSVEADLESGQGCVAVRDAATLVTLALWPTHGIDAHQVLLDADGSLLLANGGVPTQPETGRAKHGLERMDSSLVRLDPRTGERLGQWRLADTRLSMRHLARGADGTVGIALQAEHDGADARAAAPVLALFDGRALRVAETPQGLAGYGGDIVADAGGFSVSAPRAAGLAAWTARGEWRGITPLPEACALAVVGGRAWAGGRGEIVAGTGTGPGRTPRRRLDRLQLDNHWAAFDTP